jgi:hypothetical protein
MLVGLAFALPGLVTVGWHLREARRREGRRPRSAFWGRSMYFHLMALIGLGFVLGGTSAVLVWVVDLVLSGSSGGSTESARAAVDAAIFVIEGAPVMWWHLRRGRRLTAPLS